MENSENKEIGLKTIFTFFINGLFSIFFITSVFITFKEKKIIASFFYFLLAVLAIIPHKLLRVTQALKIVILIILFVILATMAAKGDPAVQQKYEHFNLGEKFNLTFGANAFSMMVKETQWDYKFTSSEKESPTTSGTFLNVKTDIINLSSKAINFMFEKAPELKDNQNRLYTLYATSLPLGAKLQPSVTKEVSYIFEIPKDASGLKFIVRDKTNIAKSVDLKR